MAVFFLWVGAARTSPSSSRRALGPPVFRGRVERRSRQKQINSKHLNLCEYIPVPDALESIGI